MSASRTAGSRSLLAGLVATLLALAGLLQAPAASAAGAPIVEGTPFALNLAPGGSASFTFAAQAGQRPGLTWLDGTMDGAAVVELQDPEGQLLQYDNLELFKEFRPLASAGSYTFRFSYSGSGTVAIHLKLSLPSDLTQPLTLGTSSTVRLTKPGQNAFLTLTVPAAQKINIDVTAADLQTATNRPDGPPGVDAELIGPRDTSTRYLGSIHGPVHFSSQLDSPGTWRILLNGVYDVTGSVTLTVSSPVEQVFAVKRGQPTTVSYAADGGNVRLTFPATAGRRLTFSVLRADLTTATGDAGQATGKVLRPDGTVQADLSAAARSFVDQADPLPVSGTYSLLLTPGEGTLGTETVVVDQVSDTTGSLNLDEPTTIGTTVPGQNAYYRFRATAGKGLVLTLANQKFTAGSAGGSPATPGVSATVIRPDGSELTTVLAPGDATGGLNFVLPDTGVYRLKVDPEQDTVGTGRLTVRYTTTTTLPLVLDKATTARIGLGETVRYTFKATAGRGLYLEMRTPTYVTQTSAGGPQVAFSVRRPDGQTIYSGNVSNSANLAETEPLVAGTYTIEFSMSAGASGRMSFTARQPVDTVTALKPEARTKASVPVAGQQARFTFRGVAGRRLTIDTYPPAWTSALYPDDAHSASYTLYRPDGSPFRSFYPRPLDDGSSWAELTDIAGGNALDVTGTWTLVVDPGLDTVGSQDFTLHQTADVRGSLSLGTPVTSSITTRGQLAAYTFSWDGTGRIDWAIKGSTFDGSVILVAPNGDYSYGSYSRGDAGSTFNDNNESGTWTVLIDPDFVQTGTATLTLSRNPFDSSVPAADTP